MRIESVLNRIRSTAPSRWLISHIRPTISYKLKDLAFPIAIDPLRNTQELLTRSYGVEAEVQNCLADLLAGGTVDHFFDIGANIGFYSWWMRAHSPATVCHLFEPDQRNIALINRTLASIKNGRLILNPVIVSDRNGMAEFYVDDITGKTGSNSLVYGNKTYAEHFFQQPRTVRDVQCLSLDQYTKLLTGHFLVKCDVEGTENLVINGALDFIRDQKPIMVIEINRNNLNTVPTLVESMGYTYRPISKAGMLDRDYLFTPI